MKREPELSLERAGDTQSGGVLKNLADRRITPARAHVLPQRLAVAIWEVLVRTLSHLLDRRQVSVDDCVTNPLLRQYVLWSAREIFGHAFHEPERRVDLIERLQIRPSFAARKNVELELVHHFVREHVLEAAKVAGHWKDHAVPQRLGGATGSFAEIAGDVVLTEL